jgi:hypothetical protein
MTPQDPYNPHSERSIGLATLGVLLVCTATGAGVGIFVAEPEIGAMIGCLVGIILGLWLVPSLMRDLRD